MSKLEVAHSKPKGRSCHSRWWSRYERTSPAHRRGQYLPPYRDHAAEMSKGSSVLSIMPSLSSTIPSCLVNVYSTKDHFPSQQEYPAHDGERWR